MRNPLSLPVIKFLPLALFLAFASPANPPTRAKAATGPQTYKIDPQQSHFMVHTGTSGFLGAFGHKHDIAIPGFSGEVSLNPEALEQSSLQMQVQAASLVLTGKVKEKDKQEIEKTMREQVLEVDKFPEIRFKSSSVAATKNPEGNYALKITGDLTLHGVTKQVIVPGQLDLKSDSLQAQGSLPLKQTDFGIKPVSVAGGSIKVKDEVLLTFTIAAHP